jgi:hypothetical protein
MNHGFNEEALRKDLEDVERAGEHMRIVERARMLYTVAKAGDVRKFHRALSVTEEVALELDVPKAMIDEWVAWGFIEAHPDPQNPRQWPLTALGQQKRRFLKAPHEEPDFLVAWIAAFERLYRVVMPRLDDKDLLKNLEVEMTQAGVDQVAARIQGFIEARKLYTVAKTGDVAAFHRALGG